MKQFNIQAAFQSWWHIGTGRGAGQHLDALCDKTPDGLPYVPGKTLKGLFRHGAECLENWGQLPQGTTRRLFGAPPVGNQPGLAGALRFSDLLLDADTRTALKAHPELKRFLFGEVASTAIDDKTGGASNKTLRVTEVTVPLTLSGTIEQLHEIEAESRFDLHEALAQICSLITHMGAAKTRGYGEVILRIE